MHTHGRPHLDADPGFGEERAWTTSRALEPPAANASIRCLQRFCKHSGLSEGCRDVELALHRTEPAGRRRRSRVAPMPLDESYAGMPALAGPPPQAAMSLGRRAAVRGTPVAYRPSPALAGIIGGRREWTALTISLVSIPCK